MLSVIIKLKIIIIIEVEFMKSVIAFSLLALLLLLDVALHATSRSALQSVEFLLVPLPILTLVLKAEANQSARGISFKMACLNAFAYLDTFAIMYRKGELFTLTTQYFKPLFAFAFVAYLCLRHQNSLDHEKDGLS